MLRANENQLEHVLALLDDEISIIEESDDGLYIDDFITFEQMAMVVDYLRESEPIDELFLECWKAYKRKGSKKKSVTQWKKLSEKEKKMVMPHIKAYVESRDVQFQQDFERYLRDRTFKTIVFKNNQVAYDPTKAFERSDGQGELYMPIVGGALSWNEYHKCYLYTGFFAGGHIEDGYTDATRPDGACIMLHNGRGNIVWSSERRLWERKD